MTEEKEVNNKEPEAPKVPEGHPLLSVMPILNASAALKASASLCTMQEAPLHSALAMHPSKRKAFLEQWAFANGWKQVRHSLLQCITAMDEMVDGVWAPPEESPKEESSETVEKEEAE